METLHPLPAKPIYFNWFQIIGVLFLFASYGAWSEVTPGDLRARLLEQEPLLPQEVTLYDLNMDGFVDVADLRRLAIHRQEDVCDAWVRGRLIDDTAGILVRDVIITLKQNGQVLATQDDQLGAYRFENLQDGNYVIEVVDPSGIYLPASVSVQLECGENIKDIHLSHERNLVLEAKDWYDSYQAGEQPAFPPEQELFDLV